MLDEPVEQAKWKTMPVQMFIHRSHNLCPSDASCVDSSGSSAGGDRSSFGPGCWHICVFTMCLLCICMCIILLTF